MAKIVDIFSPHIEREGAALATYFTIEELWKEHAKLKAILMNEATLPSVSEIACEQIQIVEYAICCLT